MEFNIFKEQIYNPAARYFKSQAKDRSTKISTSKNNDDKVKADIFSFQWQAAVESKRQAALAEFELINLYVNEHLKKI